MASVTTLVMASVTTRINFGLYYLWQEAQGGWRYIHMNNFGLSWGGWRYFSHRHIFTGRIFWACYQIIVSCKSKFVGRSVLSVISWLLICVRTENPLSLTMDRPWWARRGPNANTTDKCRLGPHRAPINILGIDYHQYCSSSYLEYCYHCNFIQPLPSLQQIHLKNKQRNDARRDHSPI